VVLGGITRLVHLNAKNTVRWAVIAACGCYGLYALIDGSVRVLTRGDVGGTGFWSSFIPLLLVYLPYSGLFIAVAYFVFRRQYRHVCTLVSALAAVVVLGFLSFLMSFPKRFGLYDWLDTWMDSPWAFIGRPLCLAMVLAMLLIPFYVAGWTYRRGQAFLARFTHHDTPPERAA
jgi:hypothetical protein